MSACSLIETREVLCSLSDFGKTCTITGLKLTKEDYQFTPVASNPSIITKFLMTDSTVPIVTNSICTAFPNLVKFDTQRDSIEEIHEDAFQNCPNLEYVDFDYNGIGDLKRNTFANLTTLRTLYLYEANIPFITDGLFDDLTNLKNLFFRRSGLTELPSEAFQSLQSLEILSIYSNNLFELDVNNILKYTPNLKTIRLNDNYFMCSRLKEILSVLRRNNVNVESDTTSRDRPHYPEKVDGVYCLTDSQWSFKLLETALHFPSTKFMEKFPLGQTILDTKTEIEFLKSGFDYINETIETALETQKVSLQSEIATFNSSMHESWTTINDSVILQSKTLEYIKNVTTTMSNDFIDIKLFKNLTNDDIKNLLLLITELKENIDQLQQRQIEPQTKDSVSGHVTGLWIITSLYLITGLVILVIYFTRVYRHSRRVYDTYTVRYKDGFVTNGENDQE